MAVESSPFADDEQLLEAFHMFDRDKSGFIDAEELAKVFDFVGRPLDSDEVKRHFDSLDLNHDGKLSEDEFRRLLSSFDGVFEKAVDQLRASFKALAGVDEEGFEGDAITVEKAKEALGPALKLAGVADDAAAIDRVVAGANANKDEWITYKEFKDLVFGVESGVEFAKAAAETAAAAAGDDSKEA